MGHLADVEKGYFPHLIGAWKMAVIFFIGSIRCIIDGAIPAVDTESAQSTAKKVKIN